MKTQPDQVHDFLYHLYRGSSLLVQDRVIEAKEELEKALAQRPRDAKGQDLLAGVYFRLGVYERAINIWQGLVAEYPSEAALKVNLGLALFKTGQVDSALDHINGALSDQPEHPRAWGYLGLIRWRRGEYAEARDAFRRGGQESMARQMEAALMQSKPPEPIPTEVAAQEHAAVRSAAREAIAQLDQQRLAVASSRTTRELDRSMWTASEPGEEHVPHYALPAPRISGNAPTLSERLDGWRHAPKEHGFVVKGNKLHVNAQGSIYLRRMPVLAVSSDLALQPVKRRGRNGQELPELFGGENPILLMSGPTEALFEIAADEHLISFRLSSELLYIRESALVGFDDTVAFESVDIEVARRTVEFTQLFGEGAVLIRASKRPSALPVPKEGLRVAPRSLLGWTGRLVPEFLSGTAPYDANTPRLGFAGDGFVLIE